MCGIGFCADSAGMTTDVRAHTLREQALATLQTHASMPMLGGERRGMLRQLAREGGGAFGMSGAPRNALESRPRVAWACVCIDLAHRFSQESHARHSCQRLPPLSRSRCVLHVVFAGLVCGCCFTVVGRHGWRALPLAIGGCFAHFGPLAIRRGWWCHLCCLAPSGGRFDERSRSCALGVARVCLGGGSLDNCGVVAFAGGCSVCLWWAFARVVARAVVASLCRRIAL